jgi:hypothetical protein
MGHVAERTLVFAALESLTIIIYQDNVPATAGRYVLSGL